MSAKLEHWFADKQHRLLAWREWRKTLETQDQAAFLESVAEWWKFVPLVNRSIDPWTAETWPTAWELVGSGEFCKNAQGLGIFYTLVLSGINCRLVYAHFKDRSDAKLLVIVDNNKVLNYSDGEVLDLKNTEFDIHSTWQSSDLARLVKV